MWSWHVSSIGRRRTSESRRNEEIDTSLIRRISKRRKAPEWRLLWIHRFSVSFNQQTSSSHLKRNFRRHAQAQPHARLTDEPLQIHQHHLLRLSQTLSDSSAFMIITTGRGIWSRGWPGSHQPPVDVRDAPVAAYFALWRLLWAWLVWIYHNLYSGCLRSEIQGSFYHAIR